MTYRDERSGVWMWSEQDSVSRRIAMNVMHELKMDAGGDFRTRDKLISAIHGCVQDCMDAAAKGSEWQVKVEEIEAVARRHASPSSNPGAHALASKLIKIIEQPQRCRICGTDPVEFAGGIAPFYAAGHVDQDDPEYPKPLNHS